MATPLRIGLFGGGIVGGGVYDIIDRHSEVFGTEATIVKICVRDASKPRSFTIRPHTTLVTDYNAILDDVSINCVIELMGGVTDAKTVVFKAISSGKHVITANKALLAQFLPEVQDLLAKNPGVRLGYEAAVCGGIPIIQTLQSSYLGDDITKVSGIMNGTTNYMLTKMELEGADYSAVLKEAQDLGFAEADPTADVEGHDVQAKIALLAKLAYGQNIPVESIPCAGISSVTSLDFSFAKSIGRTIKLVGTAQVVEENDTKKLSVFVSPVLAPLDHPLAQARGSGNIVVIASANLTQSSYSGPGAGRFPTANSVVSDILRVSRGLCGQPFPREGKWDLKPDYVSKFYVRLAVKQSLGVALIVDVGKVLQASGISLESMIPEDRGHCAVLTSECNHSQIVAMCAAAEQSKWSNGKPMFMAII